MRRLPYENKMHAKGTKQVRESAAVIDCPKISCVRKVGEPRIRKLSAYEISSVYSSIFRMSPVLVLCNLLPRWVCYACQKFWKFLPEFTVVHKILSRVRCFTYMFIWPLYWLTTYSVRRSPREENTSLGKEDISFPESNLQGKLFTVNL